MMFIFKYWQGIIAVIFIAIIGALLLMNANLKTDVANQKIAIAQLTDANQAFAVTVKQQNASIDGLKLEAGRKSLAIAAAMIGAQKAAQSWANKAASIESAPVGADDCLNVKTLLGAYYKGYSQ